MAVLPHGTRGTPVPVGASGSSSHPYLALGHQMRDEGVVADQARARRSRPTPRADRGGSGTTAFPGAGVPVDVTAPPARRACRFD
ncbi:hypothetical protein ACIGXF_30030 [Streptomyces sp. NPDC053086]|uniref:hypothetical protein n=1 Tax=unclassified Streptomyces TaxID=2593676 RepID=UPI0037D6913E